MLLVASYHYICADVYIYIYIYIGIVKIVS